MAHFAKIENNTVTDVIVINDKDLQFQSFPDSEPIGQQAILNYGFDGLWLQTSYNTRGNVHPSGFPFRKNFAGIGYTYDFDLDAFIEPKPYPSWILNTNTGLWEPPIPYPSVGLGDGYNLFWDEDKMNWVSQYVENGVRI